MLLFILWSSRAQFCFWSCLLIQTMSQLRRSNAFIFDEVVDVVEEDDNKDDEDTWMAALWLGNDNLPNPEVINPEATFPRSRARSLSCSRLPSLQPTMEPSEGQWIEEFALQQTPKPAADSQSELEAIYHQVLLPTHSDWFFKQQTCGLIGDRLPIYFHHYDACCSQTLQRMVASFAEGDFYVGATVNPRTRWLGRGQTDEREAMVGHYAKWTAMVMVAFTAEGPRLEASLIKFALRVFGDRCANRVADPRGQVRGVNNWIYVCL